MRPEFEILKRQALAVPPEELPRFLADLEEIRVTALARLTAPRIETRPDELLDAGEAAARLHVSKGYLYRNHHKLNFSRRVGRRLLFSSVGLDTYLKKSR